MKKSFINNNFKKSKLFLCTSVLMLSFAFSGCGKEATKPVVSISIWTDPANESLVASELEEFKELHKNEADFVFNVSVEDVDTCKATVLSNPEGAADIFTFADDQLSELYNGGTLLEITKNQNEVIESVGGSESGAVMAASRNNKLYAYPITAGNGYFLYYNSAYFSEDDVKDLDTILNVASDNGKKFSMDYNSGWYIYSFFKGAGLNVTIDDDGNNVCDWNSTDNKYTGVQVANSMLSIAKNPGFVSLGDEDLINGIQNGEIIAGINGAWNAEKISAAWGDDYAATMLPSYSINNDKIQMYSFMGYKLMGVNSKTKEPEWAMEVASFLTNEENQLKRFANTGESPANVKAASSPEVLASPAIAALAMQSRYGSLQYVAENYWDPSSKLGIILASGNRDNLDLQTLLNDTVTAITASTNDK